MPARQFRRPPGYYPPVSYPVAPPPPPSPPRSPATAPFMDRPVRAVLIGVAAFTVLLMVISKLIPSPAPTIPVRTASVAPPTTSGGQQTAYWPPTNQPTHVPPPEKVWTQIAFWSGENIKSTQFFTVGSEWAIEWATQPGDHGETNFIVESRDHQGGLGDLVANTIGAGHAVSYKHRAGTYYLEVHTSQPWQISIWDRR